MKLGDFKFRVLLLDLTGRGRFAALALSRSRALISSFLDFDFNQGTAARDHNLILHQLQSLNCPFPQTSGATAAALSGAHLLHLHTLELRLLFSEQSSLSFQLQSNNHTIYLRLRVEIFRKTRIICHFDISASLRKFSLSLPSFNFDILSHAL
jgi:hypothetical protein